MKPVTVISGKVAALDRANVDTDQIIPKQFLKRVERSGFGEFLFWDWFRQPGFPLNRIEFHGAPILAAGPQLRLGQLPRARALGAAGLRLRGDRGAQLLGHLLLQLHARSGCCRWSCPSPTCASCSTARRQPATIDLERRRR